MGYGQRHTDDQTETTQLTPSSVGSLQGQPTNLQQNWDQSVQILQLKENEFIYKEGESPKGLYLVKSGAVKLYVNRPFTRGRIPSPQFLTKIVGPGEYFGYRSLVKGQAYKSFAQTLRSTEIHLYPKENIAAVINNTSSVVRQILHQAAIDLDAYESIDQLHYLASVQERIAYQLVLLSDKFGIETPQGKQLSLKLTRNELAQLAGTINESLSRHLTEFKNEGIIELAGRDIIIKNRPALMVKSGNFFSQPEKMSQAI